MAIMKYATNFFYGAGLLLLTAMLAGADNLLLNPGFETADETGLQATNWWHYTADSSGTLVDWAKRSGNYGAAFHTANQTYGGFGQDVSVALNGNDIVTFSIYGRGEAGYDVTNTTLGIDFYRTTAAATALVCQVALNVYSQLATNWTRLALVYTNPFSGITRIVPRVDYADCTNLLAGRTAQWDDAALSLYRWPEPPVRLARYEPVAGVYLGALLEDGGSGDQINALNQQAGKNHAVYAKFMIFKRDAFPTDWFNLIRTNCPGAGAHLVLEPMIDFEDFYDATWGPGQPTYDEALAFVTNCAAQNLPIFLRFGHEANGDWYPWAPGYPKTDVTPADYIKGFQNFAALVHAHASNVVMVWAPNQGNGPWPLTDYARVYPGDEAVDWVGLSVYNGSWYGNSNAVLNYQFRNAIQRGYWQDNPSALDDTEQDFYWVFSDPNNPAGHRKPMMIAETSAQFVPQFTVTNEVLIAGFESMDGPNFYPAATIAEFNELNSDGIESSGLIRVDGFEDKSAWNWGPWTYLTWSNTPDRVQGTNAVLMHGDPGGGYYVGGNGRNYSSNWGGCNGLELWVKRGAAGVDPQLTIGVRTPIATATVQQVISSPTYYPLHLYFSNFNASAGFDWSNVTALTVEMLTTVGGVAPADIYLDNWNVGTLRPKPYKDQDWWPGGTNCAPWGDGTVDTCVWVIVADTASLPAPTGMVFVPAGTVYLGDMLGEGAADERPAHTNSISAFFADRCEISKAQWDTVRNWALTRGYADLPPAWGGARTNNPGPGIEDAGYANHPAVCLNWYDAVKWCNARSEMDGLTPVYYTTTNHTTVYRTGTNDLTANCVNWAGNGYRLPTEAEWEKAARGGLTGKRYPWGDEVDGAKANYWDSGDAYANGTTPCGYYDGRQVINGVTQGMDMANGYGLYDMAGNAMEWVWDRYSSNYYAAATYQDPKGPDSGAYRVMRGGAFVHAPGPALTCSDRIENPPTAAVGSYGFRSVRAAASALRMSGTDNNTNMYCGGNGCSLLGADQNWSGGTHLSLMTRRASSANRLWNGDFEQDLAPTDVDTWMTPNYWYRGMSSDTNVVRSAAAARSGAYGMAFLVERAWTNTPGGQGGVFGQKRWVNVSYPGYSSLYLSNGNVFAFSIYGYAEAHYVSATSNTYLELVGERGATGATHGVIVWSVTNNIYDELVAARGSWNKYTVVATNTDPTIDTIWCYVRYAGGVTNGGGAENEPGVRWDDASLLQYQTNATPFESTANPMIRFELLDGAAHTAEVTEVVAWDTYKESLLAFSNMTGAGVFQWTNVTTIKMHLLTASAGIVPADVYLRQLQLGTVSNEYEQDWFPAGLGYTPWGNCVWVQTPAAAVGRYALQMMGTDPGTNWYCGGNGASLPVSAQDWTNSNALVLWVNKGDYTSRPEPELKITLDNDYEENNRNEAWVKTKISDWITNYTEIVIAFEDLAVGADFDWAQVRLLKLELLTSRGGLDPNDLFVDHLRRATVTLTNGADNQQWKGDWIKQLYSTADGSAASPAYVNIFEQFRNLHMINWFHVRKFEDGMTKDFKILADSAGVPNYSSYYAHVASPYFLTNVIRDSQGNGIDDAWAVRYFGAVTACVAGADSDGDGLDNWREYISGTDPRTNISYLGMNAVIPAGAADAAAGFRIQWSSATNRVYTLARSTNLISGFFVNVATNLFATPTLNVYTDAVPGAGPFYYRVRAVP